MFARLAAVDVSPQRYLRKRNYYCYYYHNSKKVISGDDVVVVLWFAGVEYYNVRTGCHILLLSNKVMTNESRSARKTLHFGNRSIIMRCQCTTSLENSILLCSCLVAARTLRILFFFFTFLTLARLTAVDVRDLTAAAACCTRREHVSAINNNIMSYMVLYYYSYRNRAAFKFVSKIEMSLYACCTIQSWCQYIYRYLVIMDRPRGVHIYTCSKCIAGVICV